MRLNPPTHKSVSRPILPPFQGFAGDGHVYSQGVALGFTISALWAAAAHPHAGSLVRDAEELRRLAAQESTPVLKDEPPPKA